MRDSPGTWGSRGCLPMPPSSPVESQGDSPSLHFWWKIRWSEKPPADSQLDGKDRRRKGQRQTGKKNKPFPTKMTTDGSCGSLAPAADGRLPAALLRPEGPAITHRPGNPGLVPAPSTNRWAEWTGWATQPGHLSPDPCCQPPAPASGTSGRPHRQCLPKTGGWRWTDRARWAEEARGSRPALALLGTNMPYRYFGTPGRVLHPASISVLWPLLLADLIWKDTSLYAICPLPTPGMRGHAAPDPPASSRTWKVSAL